MSEYNGDDPSPIYRDEYPPHNGDRIPRRLPSVVLQIDPDVSIAIFGPVRLLKSKLIANTARPFSSTIALALTKQIAPDE